jgi:hypothetical protein
MTMEDLFGQKVDYKKLSPIVQRYLIADVRGMRLNMDPDEYFGGDWLQPSCYEGFSFDREGVTFALDLGAESLNGYHTKVLYEDIASLFAPTSLVYKYVHEPARELQEMRAPRHLLLPGDHHGEEVSSKSGERWLAFNRDRAGGILCERVLKVEKIPDPVGSTRTGKRVSTTAGAKPLFLIRGIAGLKPARIQCANLTESKQLGPNETLAFKFGGTQYTLSIKTWKSNTKDPGEDTSESNYFDMQEISLSDGKQTQIVNSLPNIHLPADTTFGPTLLWAGDLDRDGKLDLLMDTSHYDNRSEWTLFLSSGVPAGDFVRKVARFITYGC